MFSGSFDPLHLGHISVITEASSMCEEFHIILNYSKTRDRIDYKQRYKWLMQIAKNYDNIIVHLVEDIQPSRDNYNWTNLANSIKQKVVKHIDVVFCGSDYSQSNIFERLYPDSSIYYTDREVIDISSSQIYDNPFKYWDFIPRVVRPYFVKKVLIIGREHSGKSTLAQSLALRHNTVYIEADIELKSGHILLESDFYEIMIRHKNLELSKAQEANKLLFIDTDCLTTLYHQGLQYEKSLKHRYYTELACSMNALSTYDLILLLESDIEIAGNNEQNASKNMLKAIFDGNGLNYKVIKGSWHNRLDVAEQYIKELMSSQDWGIWKDDLGV